MSTKESIAVVIPIYNEEACIEELIGRLMKLKETMDASELSFILVNDGSSDKSLEIILRYAKKYEFIKVINLSRNFGHQLAITAGLDHVYADYVAIIDADLQDPPELIRRLYEKIMEGYDVVYAKRVSRKKESFLKLTTARLFYGIINLLCKVEIPSNAGDFRMINQKVLIALQTMRERHRFVRGMVPWLGFRSAPIYYDRDKRFAGETKFTFQKMFNFALDAIFSFSIAPLRLAGFIGIGAILFGIFGGGLILYFRLFTAYFTPGITAVIMTIIIIGGVQIIMIGIVGEYIGRIFEEAKNRPLYVVDSLVNFSNQQIK